MKKKHMTRCGMAALLSVLLLAGCGDRSEGSVWEETVPSGSGTVETEQCTEAVAETEEAVTEAATETVEAAAESETAAETAAPEPEQGSEVYTIVRAEGGADWSSVPVLTLDNIQWRPDCGVRAQGQFCYDETHLYVHLSATEQDIRAEYSEPMSPVYQDSCLEFFFMPADGDRYFNFEINPNGCLYVGCGHDRSDSAPQPRDEIESYFDIRSGRTADGWEVFYTIPLSFMDEYYPGYQFAGELRANVYKCGDETAQPHYLTWHEVETEKPDYHRPEYFGTMRFAE